MAEENFYEAAIRHWTAGILLEHQEEYDNAVCMQGFAAECALKKITERIYDIDTLKKYGHLGENLFQDIKTMLSGDLGLASMLDPSCGLRLSAISLPAVLFQEHPERRYFSDGIYSRTDAENCRNAVTHLLKEMVSMRLDGYI